MKRKNKIIIIIIVILLLCVSVPAAVLKVRGSGTEKRSEGNIKAESEETVPAAGKKAEEAEIRSEDKNTDKSTDMTSGGVNKASAKSEDSVKKSNGAKGSSTSDKQGSGSKSGVTDTSEKESADKKNSGKDENSSKKDNNSSTRTDEKLTEQKTEARTEAENKERTEEPTEKRTEERTEKRTEAPTEARSESRTEEPTEAKTEAPQPKSEPATTQQNPEPPAGQPDTQAPIVTCSHNWIWKTHIDKVHHDAVYEDYIVADEYDEPVYENHSICNGCGLDLTAAYGGATTDAGDAHIGECLGSYHSEDVVVGYIHHDAEYSTRCIQAAYDEEIEVKDYQYCSICGERK
jgi:hypothetical protein